MLFFLRHGYRVIARDRRGHGRSTQVSDSNDMNHYADDLGELAAHRASRFGQRPAHAAVERATSRRYHAPC